MKKDEDFLPIGTIVSLLGGTKKIMIVGYCPIDENQRRYDYTGCLYPEGIITANDGLLFNRNQIINIHREGFKDEEFTRFNKRLIDAIKISEEEIAKQNQQKDAQ